MAYRSLPEFNPEARFIANRAFLYNGQQLHPGDAVEGVPTRRLRQLYQVRWLVMASEGEQRKEAVQASKKATRKA